jgi:SAM-dependent methyltransferase
MVLSSTRDPPAGQTGRMDRREWDDRYAASDLVWSAGPNQFVAEVAGALPPGRALDVACGEGRNAIRLAEKGWDAVGVDFSAVAIEKAGRIAAARGVEVDWRVGDVTDPDVLGDETFDLVVVAYLHLPEAEIAGLLAELARLLRPGGLLLVVGHHVENLERGYGGPPDRTVLHDPATIAGMLGGLEVEHVGEVHRTVATDDGERTAIDSLVVARRSA